MRLLKASFAYILKCLLCLAYTGRQGAGLVPWAGGPPNASFMFYLREAFQSQTNTEEDIIQQESLGTDML